jgi:hypothetical protein
VPKSKSKIQGMNKDESKLRKELKTLTPKVTDKVVKIKLSEVSNLLSEISETKVIKENHILNLLRYNELIKELKKV